MSRGILKLSAVLVLARSWSFSPAYAGNGSIGIFLDPDCGTCGGTVGVGVPFTLHVNARLAGATAGGIVGADFRVVGMPPAWLATVTPNPQASATLGNPFELGCQIGFRECQTQACVNLYSIEVVPTTSPVDVRLSVALRATPLCQPFCAIFLAGCDSPGYTRYAVPGGAVILNGPDCTVATRPILWSIVKQLYKG
jgi:hypothetical protein